MNYFRPDDALASSLQTPLEEDVFSEVQDLSEASVFPSFSYLLAKLLDPACMYARQGNSGPGPGGRYPSSGRGLRCGSQSP